MRLCLVNSQDEVHRAVHHQDEKSNNQRDKNQLFIKAKRPGRPWKQSAVVNERILSLVMINPFITLTRINNTLKRQAYLRQDQKSRDDLSKVKTEGVSQDWKQLVSLKTGKVQAYMAASKTGSILFIEDVTGDKISRRNSPVRSAILSTQGLLNTSKLIRC